MSKSKETPDTTLETTSFVRTRWTYRGDLENGVHENTLRIEFLPNPTGRTFVVRLRDRYLSTSGEWERPTSPFTSNWNKAWLKQHAFDSLIKATEAAESVIDHEMTTRLRD